MDDEVSGLIKSACEIARNLESSIPNNNNNIGGESSESVLRRIDEIVMNLNAAKGKLLQPQEVASEQEMTRVQQQQHHHQIDSSSSLLLQEWLSMSRQFVQMPQLQAPAARATTPAPAPAPAPTRGSTLQVMTDLGVRDVDDVEASPSSRRRKR